jgi:hypothetical protein
LWNDVLKRQVDVACEKPMVWKFKKLFRGWGWSEHNVCLARIIAGFQERTWFPRTRCARLCRWSSCSRRSSNRSLGTGV